MQKGLQEYYRNLSKDEKIKKWIMLTIEIEIWQKCIEKKEKNIWKIIIKEEKTCYTI